MAATAKPSADGVPVGPVTAASFSDPAGLDSVSGDTATIKWGDGGTDTGRVFASGNTIYVTGSHSYARSGNYQVSTSLQSGGGSSASATAQVSVAEAALTAGGQTLSATEGQSANLTVATFADPNSNALNGDFQVSIAWGDGTSDAADNVTGAPANFSVVSSHTYTHFGSYTVSTTITDSGGATATATSQVTVADATVTATGVNLALLTNGLPSGPVATFIDANPGSQASDFSATIDWGNGTTSPGTVAGWGGVFTVSNDIVYQQSGSYPVSITILEQGQVVATAAATATVGDLLEGRASTLTVAGFSDANPVGPGSYVATIAWGDGTTAAGTVTGGSRQYSVQGTHTYKSAAAFAITVSVVDGSSSLSFTGSVRVADAPLTVLAANVSPVEGQALSSVPMAIFTDANPYSTAADFTPVVTWDDSTASSVGAVSGSGTGPIFTVLASHLYANAGTDPIAVIVGAAVARGGATALVQPNWNDATKYRLDLSVLGSLGALLPGGVPNGVANYLPGYIGNLPNLFKRDPGTSDTSFDPQGVHLELLGVSETLLPVAGISRVAFAIATTTSLPGYAGNATSLDITGPTKNADYSFDRAVNRMQAAPGDVYIYKAASVPLFVKDYGGKATVTAALIGKDGRTVLHTFELTIPVDKNKTADGIADVWEIAQAKALNLQGDPLTIFNANWDQNPFSNTTNAVKTTNSATKFPTSLKGAVGDGLSLFYEYRGVLVDGGGFDAAGKNPAEGHVRLSAAVKNVLLDVDIMKAQDKLWTSILDDVAKAYSQASYGAGVKLYYRLGNQEAPDRNFTGTGKTAADKLKDVLSQMANYVHALRETVLRVPVHQFWRHLTIANASFNTTELPDSIKKQLLEQQISGFSSGAGPAAAYPLRFGSFLFYRDASTVFKEILAPTRAIGQDPSWLTYLSRVIIHELAHQLDRTPGHYKDSTGDGNVNQADDFETVQFDYTQKFQKTPPPALRGYIFQDYVPFDDGPFKFGHAFKQASFVTNMLLDANSFLDKPPKKPGG